MRALSAAGFAPTPLTAGDADLRTATLCGAWPMGSQWVVPVYRSTPHPSPGDDPEHFSSRSVNAQIQRVLQIPLDQQRAGWNAIDRQTLRRSWPVIPLWYSGVAMAHGSAIHGMYDDSTLAMPTWKDLWVRP